jgi:hypothetical protein
MIKEPIRGLCMTKSSATLVTRVFAEEHVDCQCRPDMTGPKYL